MQDGAPRVSDLLTLGQLLVMDLASISWAEVGNTPGSCLDDDHVLITMTLFLAAVMKGLFFRLFRSLAAALGSINDVIMGCGLLPLGGSKLRTISFRHHAEGSKRVTSGWVTEDESTHEHSID